MAAQQGIKRRIRSVTNTRQITKAMQLIAVLGIIVCLIYRGNQDETEYIIPAAEVAELDKKARMLGAAR